MCCHLEDPSWNSLGCASKWRRCARVCRCRRISSGARNRLQLNLKRSRHSYALDWCVGRLERARDNAGELLQYESNFNRTPRHREPNGFPCPNRNTDRGSSPPAREGGHLPYPDSRPLSRSGLLPRVAVNQAVVAPGMTTYDEFLYDEFFKPNKGRDPHPQPPASQSRLGSLRR